MKESLLLSIIMLISFNVMANKNLNNALGEYAWKKRQLIVFTPSIKNQKYLYFNKVINEFAADSDERKLQSWHVISNGKVLLNNTIRSDISSQEFRDTYWVKDEFLILLIGYDQKEKLRLQSTNLDTIFSKIDQMPMRIQELQKN